MSEMTMKVKNEGIDSPTEVKRTRRYPTFVPQVDIYEVNDTVTLLANMPGVDEQSLDITLDKNLLTIKGQTFDFGLEGYEKAYAEYRIGEYERSFTLSDVVNRSEIEATLNNGVLRLTMPKSEEARVHKIPVTVKK